MTSNPDFPTTSVVEQDGIIFGNIHEDDNFDDWEGEEERKEGEEEDSEKTEKESVDSWNIIPEWSDEGEFHEDEEEPAEVQELFSSSSVSSAEKSEPSLIPAEISADREAIIIKIKELQEELSELKRRNRILEIWAFRNMKKVQDRITPADPTKTIEQMEEVYREALKSYKMQIDGIMAQQADLKADCENYLRNMQAIKKEDDELFQEFLQREKEVAIDLVFAKTGKRVTEKMMNAWTRRQMSRRGLLARDRARYVLLQHRLEDLKTRLKMAETLGEGMTSMDYEALHVANMGYKNRLDDRDQELEKLRIKIAETVNGLAQFKEKEICIVEDIQKDHDMLKSYREQSNKIRKKLNRARRGLNDVRSTLHDTRVDAGLKVAQNELVEMEKMMKLNNILKRQISDLHQEIDRYQVAKQELQQQITESYRF